MNIQPQSRLRGAARALAPVAAAALLALAGCASQGGGSADAVPSRPQSGVSGDQPRPRRGGGAAAPSGTVNYLDAASEDELGQAVAAQVINQNGGIDNDAKLAQYVNLVGLTVATASDQPDRDFTFGVLSTDAVGTFSAPGGYVLVTRGAIQRMQDEAELAGALAHELAHLHERDQLVALRDTVRLDDLDKVARSNDRSAKFDAVADGVVEVVTRKGYGSAREAEAEGKALIFLDNANYSPESYLNFLKRVQGQARGVKFTGAWNAESLSARVNQLSNDLSDESIRKSGQKLPERFRQYVPKPAAKAAPAPAPAPAKPK